MTDLAAILDNLAISEVEPLNYHGQPNDWPNRHVFGGHVLAQAVDAATRTVDKSLSLHSLHSYFLRAGKADLPISYSVDVLRDGRSFSSRRVVAYQDHQAIYSIGLSFHAGEPGYEHQPQMPEVPDPDTLPYGAGYYGRFIRLFKRDEDPFQHLPFEARAVTPVDVDDPKPMPAKGGHWLRLRGTIGDDPALHERLLAYISDFGFMSSLLRPHGILPSHPTVGRLASLDHAMWFRTTDFRVDDWLYYETEGLWMKSGRGLCRGNIYRRDGTLIASTAQEGLIRLKSSDEPKA
ncbi:acyl-CoA thioesterase [Pseudokordiimonas caeni]|uniref:acyl-CoA thioesterase n=1 Tax=Pseudokordiimonas caeni TaxID=2997908 RepID=UPI0028120FDC|nr:acyl-CoA thioesterase II [Pseudokordiimonas caeni]